MNMRSKLILLPALPAVVLLALTTPASAASSHPQPLIRIPHFTAGMRAPTARHTVVTGTQPSTYVSTTGHDVGTCPSIVPCKTITYAESQTAVAGTIHVAAGTYNQTANLTQPLHLAGAGKSKVIIDGTGIDYTLGGYYGVLGIDNTSGTAGTITISGLTVTHPYITATEANQSQSPVDIANYESTQSGDTVKVGNVALGPAQDEATYGGIGYYSLNAVSNNKVYGDSASGMFQAYFAEGSSGTGTTSFSHDTATNLAGLTYQSTYYPAEGLFALADTSATLSVTARYDSFTGYGGFGIAGEAGYSSGNCTANVCTGGLVLGTYRSSFGLTAAPAGSGAAAISLYAGPNDSLTANLNYSSGTVVSPDMTVNVQSNGGTVNVTDSNNTITVTP